MLLAAAVLTTAACGDGVGSPGSAADPAPKQWRATALSGPDPGGRGLSGYGTQRLDRLAVIVAGADYRQSGMRVATLDTDRARWLELESSPLWWRYGQSTVSTGEELLIWGGCCGGAGEGSRAEGAAYDAVRRHWRELPDSPLAGGHRHWHTAVWTGREMIVWGGTDHSRRGAAYDPDRQRWRLIPPAPIEPRRRHVAVWTGREMIVWGGLALQRGEGAAPGCDRRLRSGAAFDPQANEWKRIPPSPLRPGVPCEPEPESSAASWTGEELLVASGFRIAAYDPEADRWRVASPPPARVRPFGTVLSSDTGLIVPGIAEPGNQEDRLTEGAAYDATSDTWRRLAPLPVPDEADQERISFAWTGRELIGWDERGGTSRRGSASWSFRPPAAPR